MTMPAFSMTGGNYQTLMNEALRQFTQGLTLADVLRQTIRETLDKCLPRSEGRKLKKIKRLIEGGNPN
ncbi:MAG: hypothetical protein HY892_20360 [Deltaproteobacteria bacterium]|nr:hypothetical protein [Deltaproteobacteria bacterium]